MSRTRTKVSAQDVLEQAIAKETAELRRVIAEREAEIRRLNGLLGKIAVLAGKSAAPSGTQEVWAEPKPVDSVENFGPGLPPEARPKAELPEIPSVGEAGDISPQDNMGEGRWV